MLFCWYHLYLSQWHLTLLADTVGRLLSVVCHANQPTGDFESQVINISLLELNIKLTVVLQWYKLHTSWFFNSAIPITLSTLVCSTSAPPRSNMAVGVLASKLVRRLTQVKLVVITMSYCTSLGQAGSLAKCLDTLDDFGASLCANAYGQLYQIPSVNVEWVAAYQR